MDVTALKALAFLILTGGARIILSSIAGFLLAKGGIDKSTAEQISGSALLVVTGFWFLGEKIWHHIAIDNAVTNASIVSPENIKLIQEQKTQIQGDQACKINTDPKISQ